MADNNSSNIVAILAILIIVIVAGVVVYNLFIAGGVETKSSTIITQPTKVIESTTKD